MSNKSRNQHPIKPQPNGCWLWEGPKDGYGCAIFSIKGRVHRVHLTLWKHKYGVKPSKLLKRPPCNNRLCVNPEHWFDYAEEKNRSEAILAAEKVARRFEYLEAACQTLEGESDPEALTLLASYQSELTELNKSLTVRKRKQDGETTPDVTLNSTSELSDLLNRAGEQDPRGTPDGGTEVCLPQSSPDEGRSAET